MSVKSLARAVVTRLKHEPVTVWGVVVGGVLNGLAAAHISPHIVDAAATVAIVLGIPVVRTHVSVKQVVEAVLKGAEGEPAEAPAIAAAPTTPATAHAPEHGPEVIPAGYKPAPVTGAGE